MLFNILSCRYPADDVAVIWVQCSQDVLDQRCDARVDKMMEAGMLQEMIDFQKEVAQAAIEKDNPKYTNGIFQTIGFKEFHEYLHSDNKTKEENIALLEKGVDKMKVRTRQYARRQLKWINQRSVQKELEVCIKVKCKVIRIMP